MNAAGEIKSKHFAKVNYPHKIFTNNLINSFFLILKDVVKQKGLDNITVEELVLEMVPKGRGTQFF